LSLIVLDTENTTLHKGHPFTPANKCCVIALAVDNDSPIVLKIEYDLEPYGDNLKTVQRFVDLSKWLVGFNLKYDIHWLRRYGIDVSKLRLWDCQVAQFIIECQQNPYPSLDEAAAYWELGKKEDVVASYWERGVDTPDIPYDIIESYAKQDINLTRSLYFTQQEYLEDKPKLKKLIELACMDLAVLEEMEWNGLVYDVEASKKKANELKGRINVLRSNLNDLVGVSGINWNSTPQISAVLYGGEINQISKQLVPFTYKDGRTVQKLKNVTETLKFPRLVEPLKKTELKDGKSWQTGSDILKDLNAKGKAKDIIAILIELADLEKEVSTYLDGLPKLIEEMGWENNTIHGNLNQCVAVTGRLSSTKPNMQNNPASVDLYFRSRYA